ncbi:MAG: aminotransferase class V-fold PLP-dependent enzyme [Clostridia bacterium]|nr:aminotransferase class V-fold PLP-dependent enzyme [Clostridia bacterium]
MIYFDNAATSRFKPKTVLDALNFDILHSANSGRSGHDDAIEKSIRIESCRNLLLKVLKGENTHDLIFTKNCTEALNLAIFGMIKGGERIVTCDNEHNSVLRPLFHLANEGKIKLTVIRAKEDGKIDLVALNSFAEQTDIFVLGGACNVTGATLDLYEVGKIAKENKVKLIVDGAQSVPYCDLNLDEYNISALACSGHKGLHGIQGTGFLAKRKDLTLKPLLYGGTGTRSQELLQGFESPDSYEAGTLFSGGIAALEEGAKWSYEKLDFIKNNIDRLSKNIICNLKSIGATIYTNETKCGVVSFNLKDLDSAYVVDILNENGIAVRAGLHCAPLVHKRLGTLTQGAVRVSVGCDNTDKDVLTLSKVLEQIVRKI